MLYNCPSAAMQVFACGCGKVLVNAGVEGGGGRRREEEEEGVHTLRHTSIIINT